MKKFYRISLLVIIFFFLTTYNPIELKQIIKKDNSFFKVNNIEVTNIVLVEKDEIINKLEKIYGKNIFFIKKDELEKPLLEIDFLNKIEVKKKYPDTLVIKVFETKPLAILFQEEKKYLLDSSSNIVSIKKKSIDVDKLPKIFGSEAEKHFIFFLKQLEKNNFKKNEIKNYYYFQIGRWDIELINGKIIKFPFENIDKAINKSIELLKRKDFENFKIIDLRINDKIIVE